MGNTEKDNPSNSEKSSSPAAVSTKDQNNVHAYPPDWASMQAFYGPHLAVPPYLNSAVASPHAPPPYIWAPQSMIPPYGSPYAAFYANGGVYPHVGIPLAGTSLSIETPMKSSKNTEGLVKKLKEFNGLAISVGNGKCDSTDHGTDHKLSDSDETEGSSDGSNRVTARTEQSSKKRSRHSSPNKGGRKGQKDGISMPHQTCNKIIDAVPFANTKEENTDTESTALELNNPALNMKSSSTSGLQPSLPNEDWLMSERELKRERRKQSNRESARRSRLRKQAEAEELAIKVKALSTENLTLASEIKKLRESAEKLKLENAALMEKLSDVQLVQREEVNLHKIDESRPKPLGTVNLLERVNNSDSAGKTNEDGESCENSSGVRLRQLLDPSPRTDAVAAG